SVDGETEKVIKKYCSQFTLPRSLGHIASKATDLTPADIESTRPTVHFYSISLDRFGLTRIRIHPRQQGRPGNFFAHTLVLPEEFLRKHQNNAFAIFRSG